MDFFDSIGEPTNLNGTGVGNGGPNPITQDTWTYFSETATGMNSDGRTVSTLGIYIELFAPEFYLDDMSLVLDVPEPTGLALASIAILAGLLLRRTRPAPVMIAVARRR